MTETEIDKFPFDPDAIWADCHYYENFEDDFSGCPMSDPDGICKNCPYGPNADPL